VAPRADDPTLEPDSATRAVVPAASPRTPAPSPPAAFAPGAIVAGRYRLVTLLGRGGMGEVYRADDLTLDQPIALKFLPEGVAADTSRLALFHNELRVARQVSHKNVCRLYDLGEADGRRFLTMEYVDGEDLAALLRRIGRFPQDRAIGVARQLCAGVAAAHERGVIHRDLKPANVMIDRDGDVRITDFGIATPVADAGGAIAGTPQYMAPEQIAGGPASTRSDIYSLGLILYEIFTGRRAHEAKTIADLKALHDTRTITTPSAIVRDLDPVVERAILRCLEKDPHQRPGSALAVAASLPGGDALAAALAAGETPSPEMLAAAGETDAMPVPLALSLAAAFLIGLVVFVVLAPKANLAGFVPLDKPPAVLADRAEQIILSLGYPDDPVDRAEGFDAPQDYLSWIERTDRSPYRWAQLRDARPGAIVFWYRTSPRDLVPLRATSGVTTSDPAEIITGMRSVILDTRGRLKEFHAVPPQVDIDAPAQQAPAWKPLFDAAGLDIGSFTQKNPEWTPHTFADARAAWEGAYPDRPDLHVRVEAAAYHGRPVSFFIVGPWTRATRMEPLQRTRWQSVQLAVNFTFYFGVLVAASLVARRNVRLNRADRRAASRLGAWLAVAVSISWIVYNHHTASANVEFNEFFSNLGFGMYLGGTLWVLYLAIEPYARRLWPDGLLGWTRFLAGHVRDPRVGRDVLIGCVFAIVLTLLETGRLVVLPLVGEPMPQPTLGQSVHLLLGAGRLVGQTTHWTYGPLQTSLFTALLFVGLRFLLRRDWAAAGAAVIVFLIIGDQGLALQEGVGLGTLFYVVVYVTMIFALLKFGLLAMTVGLVVDDMLTTVPFPARLSGWAAAPAEWTVVLAVAIVCFGFYAARAGRPLFGDLGQA
jgi:hypothetical protein